MSAVLVEAGASVAPDTAVGSGIWIRTGTTVSGSVLGDGTFVGFRCRLDSADIGAGSLIASEARIGRVGDVRTRIGSGAWIGARAVIEPGVRVGGGAVVAAGAHVTDDVADDAVVAGAPARLLRRRTVLDDGLPDISRIIEVVRARRTAEAHPLPRGWLAGSDCQLDADMTGGPDVVLGDEVIAMGRADGPSEHGGVRFGAAVTVGARSILEASSGIDIGARTVLGRRVLVLSSGHDMGRRSLPWQAGPITIGADCRIGDGATIVGPVDIGDGATVTADALVVSDVPAGNTTSGILRKRIR
ncbi:DapH/DapD/GlmU-related protein [Streptomyces sp. NPDC002889]|uniref:DapH/DapD/GlmU-related protein n=1 Tax=Streptomyces sp. NPDC002889 TaxID=3364669 RepID=UPI0036AAFBD3